MAESASPLAQVRYRISLEQYLDFNFSVAEQNYKAQRRKSTIMGIIEIAVGILFTLTLVMTEAEKRAQIGNFNLYLILGIVLVLLGLYSVVFYQVIFPKQLKKSATKTYNKSDYLKGEILLEVYEDHLFEESGTYSDSVAWGDTKGFRETPTMLQIMLGDTRCILIPKKQIPGRVNELREIFLDVAQKYDLNYKRVSV